MSSTSLVDSNLARLARYVEASISVNTRINWGVDLDHFCKWGGILPATPEMLVTYLMAWVEHYNPVTLARRLKAIRYWHKINGQVDPTQDAKVVQLMKGIKNLNGKPTVKAAPLTLDDIKLINSTLIESNRRLDQRNNALIQIGFFGAFRRSELVAIQYEHLKFSEDGVEIFIPRSKVDQEGNGAICAIPRFTKAPYCPVATLERWLATSKIVAGPIFKTFKHSDVLQDKYMDPRDVNLVIKKLVAHCGIGDPNDYSGHSLRRGFATMAAINGSRLETIMRQGRWTEPRTVIGYIDDANKFSNNAAGALDF